MSEFKKFNPQNMRPDLFCAPPTQVIESEVDYLSRNLVLLLEYGSGDASLVSKKRELRLGTELEVFFFSPDADPWDFIEGDNYDRNPNYASEHNNKMTMLCKWAEQLSEIVGVSDCDSIGRLGIEFRTEPANLSSYTNFVNRLVENIRVESKELDVLPIVHSQHIHMSLFDGGESIIGRNLEENPFFKNRILHRFSKEKPSVLLPEEFYVDTDPILFVQPRPRRRLEFRMLSSEFACDPDLNTLLSLWALLDALPENEKPLPVQKFDNFDEALNEMRHDKESQSFFGKSTLSTLCGILEQYPKVSRREIAVDEIKTKF